MVERGDVNCTLLRTGPREKIWPQRKRVGWMIGTKMRQTGPSGPHGGCLKSALSCVFQRRVVSDH